MPLDKIAQVSGFLKKNGFYAVQGFGLSVVPRDDGLNNIKMFVRRDDGTAALPLWRGIVGTAPSPMGCLSYLPKDTVLARSGTADIKAMWHMIKAGIVEIGGAEAAKAFNESVAQAEQQIGGSIDAILGSIAPEAAIAINVSSTSKVPMPMGEQAVEVPQVSLLVVMAVRDESIVNTLRNFFATNLQSPLPEQVVGKARLYPVPIPVPSPMPVQLTVGRHGRYLLIGSTPAVINEAIEAATRKNGLRNTREFRTAFQGHPAKNNGILFVSKRLGDIMAEVQKDVVQQAATHDPNAGESMDALQQLISDEFSTTSAFTIMNYKSGIKISGTSASGGREIIGGVAIAPVGLLSAIAIPSFVKARATARGNACINNLRMLDAAKEQWALAKRRQEGDEPVESEALEYVKGASMPICPQGGSYTLNVIGKDPTCSQPGHALP